MVQKHTSPFIRSVFQMTVSHLKALQPPAMPPNLLSLSTDQAAYVASFAPWHAGLYKTESKIKTKHILKLDQGTKSYWMGITNQMIVLTWNSFSVFGNTAMMSYNLIFADVDLYKGRKQLLPWILADAKAMHNDYDQNNGKKNLFSLSSTKPKQIITQLHNRSLLWAILWSHSFSFWGLSYPPSKALTPFASIM